MKWRLVLAVKHISMRTKLKQSAHHINILQMQGPLQSRSASIICYLTARSCCNQHFRHSVILIADSDMQRSTAQIISQVAIHSQLEKLRKESH